MGVFVSISASSKMERLAVCARAFFALAEPASQYDDIKRVNHPKKSDRMLAHGNQLEKCLMSARPTILVNLAR